MGSKHEGTVHVCCEANTNLRCKERASPDRCSAGPSAVTTLRFQFRHAALFLRVSAHR